MQYAYTNGQVGGKIVLYVQELVTHFIVTYYIKWVTTSWTDGMIPSKRRKSDGNDISLD